MQQQARGEEDQVVDVEVESGERTIVTMILLSGFASLIIANAYQAQMPEFGADLGHGDPDMSYSALLAADPARRPAGRTRPR